MNIAVDAVGIKHGGGATVLLDLLRTLLTVPKSSTRVTLFLSPRPLRRFDLPSSDKLVLVEVPFAEKSLLGRVYWALHGFRHAAEEAGATVSLALTGVALGPRRARRLVFVQQALPFCREALAVLGIREKLRLNSIRLLTGMACKDATKVIVQTPTMVNWVSNAFGIDESNIDYSIPCATKPNTDNVRSSFIDRSLASDRLLYVGSDSAHKNLSVLLEAFRQVRRVRPAALLYLVGEFTDLKSEDGIVNLGYLNEAALANEYIQATMLIMPSLVETVGLPMLEAMAVGTPVLAADRPYAHDVCGTAAEFFDPLRPSDLADHILRLLSDPVKRLSLGQSGLARCAELQQSEPYIKISRLLLTEGDKS